MNGLTNMNDSHYLLFINMRIKIFKIKLAVRL